MVTDISKSLTRVRRKVGPYACTRTRGGKVRKQVSPCVTCHLPGVIAAPQMSVFGCDSSSSFQIVSAYIRSCPQLLLMQIYEGFAPKAKFSRNKRFLKHGFAIREPQIDASSNRNIVICKSYLY